MNFKLLKMYAFEFSFLNVSFDFTEVFGLEKKKYGN